MAQEQYATRAQYKKYKRYMKAQDVAATSTGGGAGPSTKQEAKGFGALPMYDVAKRADFALVYSKSEIEASQDKINIISTFTKNIKQTGLTVEEQAGLILDDLTCILITASSGVLTKYVAQFRIELAKDNPYYQFSEDVLFGFMGNLATDPKEEDPIFQRAVGTLSGERPKDFTNAEKILVVDRILTQTKYGDDKGDIGYQPLVDKGIFLAAYPLHDSQYEWTDEGPLSDRQLLAKYWASLKCICKEQPLSLINKYYGPEVGFYFAWLGCYIKFLLVPAIVGLICFLLSLIYYYYEKPHIEREVCQSDQMLCPVCPIYQRCSLVPLRNACHIMKITQFIENPVNIIYSVLMCFWGIIFMLFWKREQSVLRLRWNLQGVAVSVNRSVRPEYIKVASLKSSLSPTEEKFYYLPIKQKLLRLAAAYLGVLCVLFIYLLAVILVIYFRLNLTYYGRKSLSKRFREDLASVTSITSAFLTLFFIAIFDMFKKRISMVLTEWENPRTQRAFHRRYTIKLSIFALCNILFPTMYIAFFKGNFYTHPGDRTQWSFRGLFKSDVCPISGCLVDLSVQIATILIVTNGMRLFAEIMMPYVDLRQRMREFTVLVGRSRTGGFGSPWEEDFVLVQNCNDFIYEEYIHLVIQYSFMTFFLVSFPMVPFLVFINAILELRVDAWKMVKHYRRPVPKQVPGIEEWNMVLHVITILGAISNPLLIAFNSNFIAKYIYVRKHNNVEGFINSTLSEFAISDYPRALKTCQYSGMRYPPGHPDRYEYTIDYWYQFAVKAVFFIILENICLLLSLFLGYIIPEVPHKIQMQLDKDQSTLQRMRLTTQIGKS